jgi:N-acetylglucosamine kinase-like BadF-type ATPase
VRCVLAIDSGGSNCTVLLTRDDGVALNLARSRGRDPNSSRSMLGAGRSLATVSDTVHEALAGTACDELHITGIGSRGLPFHFRRDDAYGQIRVHFSREYEAALALAGERFGLVALAGTGAFAYAKRPDGTELLIDGLGPLLGDHGSGYQIGFHVIRAVGSATWHPRHSTSLTAVVLRKLGIDPDSTTVLEDLVAYTLSNPDRTEFASFATLASQEARSGDRVAREIICKAAEDLAETTRNVVDRMNLAEEPYPLVGTGGVIAGSDLYWEHFCSQVRQFAPRVRPIRPEAMPVTGIALTTLLKLAAVDEATLRQNLLSSVQQIASRK